MEWVSEYPQIKNEAKYTVNGALFENPVMIKEKC